MSTDQEINTMPIIAHIQGRGAAAFVPQYAGGKMKMLRLEPDDEKAMPLTRHGIQQHSKEMQREDALERGENKAQFTPRRNGMETSISPHEKYINIGNYIR